MLSWGTHTTVDKGMYQMLVGKLIYRLHTTPDVTFAVSLVGQFICTNQRSFIYTSCSSNCAIFERNQCKEILFKRNEIVGPETYIDVDYVGSIVDRRSTTGYCTFLVEIL
jgi:hypothetical protein